MIRCCIASHSLCYPQQAPKITVILFLSLQSKQENQRSLTDCTSVGALGARDLERP